MTTRNDIPPMDFKMLYQEHFAFVYRHMRRAIGPDDNIEDLVQDVFTIAYKKLATFNGCSKYSTWLYGITWRVASHYRRSRRLRRFLFLEPKQDAEFPESGTQNPEEALQHRQAARVLYRLLDRLPEKKRQVFILYELEGYSGNEIAELVGCKEGTVWTRLHHARNDLLKMAQRNGLSRYALHHTTSGALS